MSRRDSTKRARRKVAESLREYGRGVAGGLMFSLPLLYTMEVWWAGLIAHPWRLFAAVAGTFLLLLGYNRYGGLRRDVSMTEVAIDSVEELGIGLVISAVMLFLLGRVTLDMPSNEIAGRVVIEAITVAIGVSVGTAQLGGGDDEGLDGVSLEEAKKGDESKEKRAGNERGGEVDKQGGDEGEIHFGGQMVLALCGAVLFAANVAPTEEIVVIAIEASWVRLLGLAAVSLLLGSFILYYSEFKGAQRWVHGNSLVTAILGTVITYAIALVASASILWFFGRFDGVTLYTALAEMVVLGVAATLGASAGRLLLQ